MSCFQFVLLRFVSLIEMQKACSVRRKGSKRRYRIHSEVSC